MKKSHLISACLGNLFEHYDTALFSFIAPFIAPLFFPKHDKLSALMLTYAIIPLGMIARPFGSLVFGYIGDIYGRKAALVSSLLGMGIVSMGMGFCPTYETAGFWAPLLLSFGKISQNFLGAGESMGGAIYLMENSEEKHHDFLSGVFNSSTIGGILLASAAVSILSLKGIIVETWQYLYYAGSITAFFGVFIRQNITYTVSVPFRKSVQESLLIIWKERKKLGIIMVMSGFSYSCYSISLVLLNGFIPLVTDFSEVDMASMNTSLLIFDFVLLIFFGWLSSKITREKVMQFSALSIAVIAIPFFTLIPEANLLTLGVIRGIFVALGVAFFAPFHAWAADMIDKKHRYLLISFGYALGTQLLGGPTAAFSLWVFNSTGWIPSIAIYWIALALLSYYILTKFTVRHVIIDKPRRLQVGVHNSGAHKL